MTIAGYPAEGVIKGPQERDLEISQSFSCQ